MVRIRHRAAHIRAVWLVVNLVVVRRVGRRNGRVTRDRRAEGVRIAALVDPAVEVMAGLIVRRRRRGHRVAVVHIRIVQVLMILHARIRIMRLLDNDAVLVDVPLCLQVLVPCHRRVEVVRCIGRRVDPAAEVITRLLSRRGGVAGLCLRLGRLVAVLHGLGGRRHIAAVGIVGHRVLRALVVIREVKRAREGRKAAAVFADLLRHREYGSDLLYLVLQGVDLAVIGVTRDAVAKLLHLVDVLAGHREAERAACHGAVALACLRVCHTANQREACGSDLHHIGLLARRRCRHRQRTAQAEGRRADCL